MKMRPTSSFCPCCKTCGATRWCQSGSSVCPLSPPPDEAQYQSEYEEEPLEGALSDMELTNHCTEHTEEEEEEETCDTVGRDALIGCWGERERGQVVCDDDDNDDEDGDVMMI